MTYVLNLEPHTAKRIEEKAKEMGVEPQQWLETVIQKASADSVSDADLESAMNRIFDRYQTAFEVLAEGAK